MRSQGESADAVESYTVAFRPRCRRVLRKIRQVLRRGRPATSHRELRRRGFSTEVYEEWKWSNPVWSHHGIVCTGKAYTKVVKLTFALVKAAVAQNGEPG